MQFPDRIRLEFVDSKTVQAYDADTGTRIQNAETLRLEADGYHGIVAEVHFLVNRGGLEEQETFDVKYRWPNLEITATSEAQTRGPS